MEARSPGVPRSVSSELDEGERKARRRAQQGRLDAFRRARLGWPLVSPSSWGVRVTLEKAPAIFR